MDVLNLIYYTNQTSPKISDFFNLNILSMLHYLNTSLSLVQSFNYILIGGIKKSLPASMAIWSKASLS
uniref:Uncharacterized protein n=1 Tax=Timema monikensis TaxID=170555 RepID=A0A7R9HNT6_9NEOP|nr:unnamed protein product [Timema monikensis]